MKKIALTVFAFAFVLSFSVASVAKDKAAGKSEKVTGWVSDAKCGAKGASASHADCAKKCEEAGTALVVVSDKGHNIINVDNQDALKGHEGHHVRVTGTVANGTMHVDKVQMLKQPKAAMQKGEHSGL